MSCIEKFGHRFIGIVFKNSGIFASSLQCLSKNVTAIDFFFWVLEDLNESFLLSKRCFEQLYPVLQAKHQPTRAMISPPTQGPQDNVLI